MMMFNKICIHTSNWVEIEKEEETKEKSVNINNHNLSPLSNYVVHLMRFKLCDIIGHKWTHSYSTHYNEIEKSKKNANDGDDDNNNIQIRLKSILRRNLIPSKATQREREKKKRQPAHIKHIKEYIDVKYINQFILWVLGLGFAPDQCLLNGCECAHKTVHLYYDIIISSRP